MFAASLFDDLPTQLAHSLDSVSLLLSILNGARLRALASVTRAIGITVLKQGEKGMTQQCDTDHSAPVCRRRGVEWRRAAGGQIAGYQFDIARTIRRATSRGGATSGKGRGPGVRRRRITVPPSRS
ncbi:hypothetical protein EVAR_8004_1 [Eumeta japonica]|uniref:Uncharacterized protein n=1 Tax=Eumeta variegata TaxID=151549 RepID=A0A4C1TKF5_EUMVA|nr:hypothetical protein EVAR_8004_1 [Eumeta japonica]